MSDEIVREKLPDLFGLLSRLSIQLNWDQIKNDLEELSWLAFEESKEVEIAKTIWNICDRWITSELTLTPRYCINDKEKIKEIVRVCVDYSQTLEFLDKAYVSLNNCGQDTFSSLATRIHDLYSELRKTISWLFMHFEKYLKQEISKNLSEIMDQAFYDKVVFPHKPRFSQDPSTKQIVM